MDITCIHNILIHVNKNEFSSIVLGLFCTKELANHSANKIDFRYLQFE